jgi:phosphatidylserine/phosphatidylglycerophosphate/cardiolipin synthase-like enzyme
MALAVLALPVAARRASASEQIYFSAVDDVTAVLVQHINAETVRLDISSWYLSEHAVSIAIANRWAAGVPVRLIGDRAAIFEADPHTKAEFYWLANQGVPIRLRFNPTWFPEIDHWKMALFVGQGLVEFGSGNFTPVELAPVSSTNYDDETELFTDDPVLVNAFKTKFDLLWNDTTTEPESVLSGPPYLKDWNDACAHEPTGNCADYATLYPTPAPMIINTARLEGDHPMPPDLIWGQGTDFNTRLVQAITSESSRIDLVVYRLEVDTITNALLSRFQAGVPVRILVDPHQYTNSLWPEYWLTHANIDKLWAAGVPIRQALHAGVTHMKTLVTSTVATNASSNFGPNWQRDHDYVVSAATKPAVYQAIATRVDAMWNDAVGFGPLQLTPPNAAALASPAAGAVGVAPTTALVWNTAAWAVSYDVYLGASPASLALVANVPAQLVTNPPATYAWTPAAPLQAGATYYWQVVSRTNATPLAPTMQASSSTASFTTSASGGGGLPSPWQHQDIGATGLTGGASDAAGTFTVLGAGADIWGSSDAFQYVDQPLTGDGQIVARVTGISGPNAFAKAGVMLRASTAAGAVHVLLDVRPGGSIEFLSRATTGGTTTYLAGATQATPVWLKLTRSGATVTGAVSADGVTWTLVGTTTVSMATGALVGLAVTSHDPTQLTTATFDTVTVGGAAPPPPGTPAAPTPASGATQTSVSPTLTWTATGATSYDVRFGATNPPPSVSTDQSTASYAPGAPGAPGPLSSGTTYFWQIIAHNASGATTGPVWSFTTAVASSCDDVLTLSDVSGTLNIGFTLATSTPATWNVWLIAQNTVTPLWSTAIPVVSPAISFNVPLAGFPHLGTAYLVTTLGSATQTSCWDAKGVDTGQ